MRRPVERGTDKAMQHITWAHRRLSATASNRGTPGALPPGLRDTLQAQVLSEERAGSRGTLPAAFCILSRRKDARITHLNSKAGQTDLPRILGKLLRITL